MKKALIIYESSDWRNYGSLAALRPVFSLRSGMTALWQSLKRGFRDYDLQLICRPGVAHVALRETGVVPNRIAVPGCTRMVFVDASIQPDEEFLKQLQRASESCFFVSGSRVLAVVLRQQEIQEAERIVTALVAATLDASDLPNKLESFGLHSNAVAVRRYSFIWDLMLANPANIGRDFTLALDELGALRTQSQTNRLDHASVIGEDDVFIHPTATILPGVVFDASDGPVYLDEDVLVEPGSYIVGPFYAAPNCRILGGKLAGSSLGPVCRIAGELEESLLQGYVNKHHAGFIGHSYIGEWVNFGAMTTNSDLKNNYSNVRVDIADELIDSGATKVGSFIGDHTKFGIGTLLNTGVNIGIFCNIFGGALVREKSIPAFSWGGDGSWQRHEVEKALQTAQRAMARRGRELAEEDLELIRSLAGE